MYLKVHFIPIEQSNDIAAMKRAFTSVNKRRNKSLTLKCQSYSSWLEHSDHFRT